MSKKIPHLELLLFFIFLASRIPFLGNEIFNTDVWKWKARIYDFGSGVFDLNFEKTLQKYHPGVTLMWIGTLSIKAKNLYCNLINSCPDEDIYPTEAIFYLHLFQKLFIVLVLGFVLSIMASPLKNLFGKKYAFIALCILIFEPFFYALSRVIHLEALMTCFMVCSFLWLFYFLKKNQKLRNLVFSSFMAGLSVLTKSSALYVVPMSFATILYLTRNLKLSMKYFIIWISVFALTYFAFWPSMWVNPIKTLEYVFIRGVKEVGIEGGHEQLFLGKFTQNPPWFYYFVVLGLKTSPFFIFGLVGFFLTLKGILRKYQNKILVRDFCLLSLVWAFGYLLEVSLPSKKLDRYIIPVIAHLSFVIAFFYVYFFNKISSVVIKKANFQLTNLLIIIVFVAAFAYQSLKLTPDYFSYYNPIFGGLARGVYLLEPKWIIGHHEVVKYLTKLMKEQGFEPFYKGQSLNNQKDLSRKLVVAFPEKYYTQIWPFVKRAGAWATIEDLRDDAQKSKYFIYPVWNDYSNLETRFKLEYFDSIYFKNVKLYNVYKKYD